jgi:hypothetical protein
MIPEESLKCRFARNYGARAFNSGLGRQCFRLTDDCGPPSFASLGRGRWSLFEDQAGDELGLGRGVLDVIADGLTIAADVEHDVLDDLDGAFD